MLLGIVVRVILSLLLRQCIIALQAWSLVTFSTGCCLRLIPEWLCFAYVCTALIKLAGSHATSSHERAEPCCNVSICTFACCPCLRLFICCTGKFAL